MTVQLLLIRHALPHTITHDPRGADPGLAPDGIIQATRLAEHLSTKPFGEISQMVSSTMRRAVETSIPARDALGVELRREERIVEVDSGWKNYGTALSHYPSRRAGWEDLNRGRFGSNTFDLDQFRDRVIRGFDAIIDAVEPDSTVAVVCHGGVISAYLSHILQTPRTFFVDTDYTSITRILAEDEHRELLSVNETHHLR
ncbi:histidine phosphatase family protein [Gordonia sp. zg691]|uniref:histidine phosphatase family protein n=1 Tax=Gordonia jinghuaiqii TaxID=2758710 RepID=UPI0016623E8B|nr:histidine phosphatase family protein [Gordonia jinghuaiqii]MBD0860334.1 histidine phosphatase family protein [Gordonia jinghuaiqii]